MVTTVTLQQTGISLVDLSAYRQQIYNFLQSVTIKFEPLLEGMSQFSLDNGIDEESFDPSERKYYLNMCGRYSQADRLAIGGVNGYIQVVSLDTQETIDFTVESLNNNPVTRTNYLPGSTYFTELCQRYPNQTDLIRGILFPVKDIEAAIEAPNLTLLNYDESFLETTEVDNIIEAIQSLLTYVRRRWDFPAFGYEPYYHVTFWSMLLQAVASTCFMARFKAIRKYGVHTFHVWSYLRSHGLDDYSDILTYQQSMFLYKNLDYLNQNRGKESTLKILAEKLLLPLDLAIYGRDVYQQTLTGNTPQIGDDGIKQKPDHKLTPEFVAKQVLDNYPPTDLNPPMNVTEMEEKLYTEGNEVSGYSVSTEQDKLIQTTNNTYPTKVLEITNVARNKHWVDLFNTYLLDTLFYVVAKDKYKLKIEIPSKNGSSVFMVNAKEALIILSYAMFRAQGLKPIEVPTGWNCVSAIRPYPYNLPETTVYNGIPYLLKSHVDLKSYLSDWKPNYDVLSTPGDLSDFIDHGLILLISQISMQRLTANGPTSACMRFITDAITIREMIPLNLTEFKTYEEFFANRSDIFGHVIEVMESTSHSQNEFDEFANSLLNTLVPITDIFRKYGDFSLSEELFERIKSLFIQLTSYNINFINGTAGRDRYFYIPHMEVFQKSVMEDLPDATGEGSDSRLVNLGIPPAPSGEDYTGLGLLLTCKSNIELPFKTPDHLIELDVSVDEHTSYTVIEEDLSPLQAQELKSTSSSTHCLSLPHFGHLTWSNQS